MQINNLFYCKFIKITGYSMYPVLRPGAYVLVIRWPSTTFIIGDLVLVKHACFNLIVKRIVDCCDTQVLLAGENPGSVSSEAMGWVPKQQILGRIVWSSIQNRQN